MRVYGQDHNSLHKILSPDILPQELGGKLGPADDIAEKWNKEFRAADAMFRSLENQSIELVKEINKKKEDVNATSVTGTFRKLNVD